MGRVHLFELEDQSWFPSPIRDAGTDFMRFMAEAANPYRPIVSRLRQALADTGSREILDLCSGAAGPIVGIREQLAAAGCPVSVTLSDKFPNETAFAYAAQRSGGGVRYVKEPVDAVAVPPHLSGFRTLFTGLHHFRPEAARRILQNAVDQRQPIGVFEMTQRSVLPILGTPFIPLALLLATPFIRPFRWSRLFWTYAVPVAPLFVAWDAFVSCLRTYSLREMRMLVDGLRSDDYHWEIGLEPARPAPISYLIGCPSAAGGQADSPRSPSPVQSG
jgi:hypothetical protein